jgi:thiol-disulfide isomerase/thioredoxin
MKLMIGILFICIGLVMGLPYLVDKNDLVAESGNGNEQLNPFASQSADSDSEPTSLSDTSDGENEIVANAVDNSLTKEIVESIDDTVVIDTDAAPETVDEPSPPAEVTPVEPKPAIDIAAYPGQTLDRPTIDHKWSSNKFITKPVAAVTNPYVTAAESKKPVAAASPAKLPGQVSLASQAKLDSQAKLASHPVQINPAVVESGAPFAMPASWHRKSVNQQQITSLENLDSPEYSNVQWSIEPQTDGRLKVVLFIATWSDSCESSIQRFNSLYSQYSDNVEFLGLVDPKGSDDLPNTVKKWGIKFPVAVDTAGEIQKRFHSHAYPSVYVIDRNEKLRCANIRAKYLKATLDELVNEAK